MKRFSVLGTLALFLLVTGCGKKVTATVDVAYTLEPRQPLAEQYMSIAVYDARMEGDKGEFDEQKWSEMTADLIQYNLQQAAEQHQVPLKLVDREHMKVALGEKDLAAADITDAGDEVASAKIVGASAILTSKITIKIDKQTGKGRTVSDIGGWGSRWGGGGSVHTDEVEKESRNITVTCQFQLKDAGTNETIVAFSGKPTQHYERGKPSPFFGGSKTESDMTPRDKIIGEIVESQLQQFLVKFVPTETAASIKVEASGNEASQGAVRMLVVDDFEGALAGFKQAISENQDDHKSLFGAGVCCEKLGQLDEALKYYKRALSLETKDKKYNAAVERVSSVRG